ncbi:MAG TPA: isoprenylcysteine carboxylmethyltransferase family protein [Pyrinomonadaceae bacterium]|nr:isoprenylcysteine carboxylmethyltransferase family protein [Pyrinomonadaceae bacterium]
MLTALLPTIVFAAVIFSWIAFAIVFLTRKKPGPATERKRESGSIIGIVLQAMSYALVWSVHRPYFTTIFNGGETVAWLIGIGTILLAVSSVAVTMSAVRTLGKEWSLTARVVEGHRLATKGPYAWVRHPIYTGMFGMLLATALAMSSWFVIPLAAILFIAGTTIRIRHEEKLLRESFGSEFDAYAARVSALIPGIY